MKKHTKVIVLVAMMVLLGVTGYLNLTLNNRIVDAQGGKSANYFADHVQTREETRQREFLFFDAIINSESSTEAQKAEAHEQKMQIIANMESELAIERLIVAKGFDEVAVTYSNNYINVIVKGEVDRAKVAQIVSVVKQQTGIDSDFITITPV